MDSDFLGSARQAIREYAQITSAMGGSRVFQCSQGGYGHTASADAHYMFAELRIQLTNYCEKQGLISLDQ